MFLSINDVDLPNKSIQMDQLCFFLTVISLSSIYNQLDILLTIDIQLNKNIWALAVTFGQVCLWMTLISDGYMRETRRFINIGF